MKKLIAILLFVGWGVIATLTFPELHVLPVYVIWLAIPIPIAGVLLLL